MTKKPSSLLVFKVTQKNYLFKIVPICYLFMSHITNIALSFSPKEYFIY